ncbi:alpha/beta fold hydrolase [Amnibacterium endophyticum]|uniref:Alpha/beta fold hydrolase n=1 Tax=Amnibacterium endophyticum TaxID=2109337 RepID=A0ABW4LK13_9MICO
MRPGPSLLRTAAALLLAASALGAAPTPAASVEAGAGPSARELTVPVREAPGSTAVIRLDAEVYTPESTPAPAVLLAHGFGQDRTAVAGEARRLQGEGYVVLAYSARGFGRSEGRIGLDSLDGEVPDARAMIDVLDADPAVLHRGGDPVVAVVGGSYGGALALMAGATDPRVDTVVAAITWNDLASALAPRSTGAPAGAALRDFKVGWGSRLFAAGIAGSDAPCGRFTTAFCDLYRRLVTGGTPTPADLALLARSSPSTVLDRMRAPTLLVQGEQDRLFGLDQADANARQLRAAGAPVQVRWFDGGHDGGSPAGGGGSTGLDGVLDGWLAAHLRRDEPVPSRFVLDVPASATSFREQRTGARYTGLTGGGTQVALTGGPATVVNPPGGVPAAVTGIPGIASGALPGRLTGLLGGTAGGSATFTSAALTAPALLAGAPTIDVRVEPAGGTTPQDAVLYAQLSVRTGDAERALPGGVAPIRFVLPAGGATVRVALPATAWSLAPGDRIALTLRTSDSQWLGQTAPAAYRVAVASPLVLPSVAVVATSRSAGLPAAGVVIGIVVALLVALLLLGVAAVRRRRRTAAAEDGPPLEVRGLTKRFRSGFLAVDDASFTVERGQVLGLLGENGAGKTTTLRMATGLIGPGAGEVRLFGQPVAPGAPALARLGCFIEGPGFLVQLTGRRNLQLYWAATGRPEAEAHLDEVLRVADLGAAIDAPVRGYSQGMRQRLAIAQAMLGLPELLVLDEPTNGLDPPQITALRAVLREYAASGRTVVVSSHLLAEVERTCSHVVVMSHGRVVAAGGVDEVAGERGLEAAFLDLIGATEPVA